MNVLNAEQLSKSYGIKTLFERVSFSMDQGDRVGLIGINGTGKSTFLKVIAGAETPDHGKISTARGLTIAYLPQNPPFDPEADVIEQMFSANSQALELYRAHRAILAELKDRPANESLQKRLSEINLRMDEAGVWPMETEARRILSKLGMEQYEAKMGSLSGGQRKRALLAGVLMNPADLLILDEPTNHLDAEATDWLEQHLSRSHASLLMITHDRYFLDRVANRMIELDQGTLYNYSGNYSYFLEKKAERLEREEAVKRKRENLLRGELQWIRRGAQARSTKQKARIERFEQLRDAPTSGAPDELHIALTGSRLGKKVIELRQVCKSMAGRPLIADFSHVLQRTDRIGIIGPNGCGKSTLLNLISGRLEPDRGAIDAGSTVKIGYFSQESAEMDGSLRVLEYIRAASEQVRTADGSYISAAQMLELFLFPPEAQWTPIAKLSGGEQRRLFLLRILMEAPNVLLLDEPTNDLDIQTLMILEQYLDGFPGTVITVSHDRYFLDRTAETIFAFEGGGRIAHHVGNYTAYRELRGMRAANAGEPTRPPGKEPPSPSSAPDRQNRRAQKFSFKEQKEYEQIEDRIAEAERHLQKLNDDMVASASDYEKLQALTEERSQAEQKLEQLLDRWTELNELAEAIEASRRPT